MFWTRSLFTAVRYVWSYGPARAGQVQDVAALVASAKRGNLGPVVLFAEGVSSNGRGILPFLPPVGPAEQRDAAAPAPGLEGTLWGLSGGASAAPPCFALVVRYPAAHFSPTYSVGSVTWHLFNLCSQACSLPARLRAPRPRPRAPRPRPRAPSARDTACTRRARRARRVPRRARAHVGGARGGERARERAGLEPHGDALHAVDIWTLISMRLTFGLSSKCRHRMKQVFNRMEVVFVDERASELKAADQGLAPSARGAWAEKLRAAMADAASTQKVKVRPVAPRAGVTNLAAGAQLSTVKVKRLFADAYAGRAKAKAA